MVIDFQIHFSPLELIKDQLAPDGSDGTYLAPDGSYRKYSSPTLKIVFTHLGGGIAANPARILSYQDKEFWGTAEHPLASKKCKMDFLEYLDMMMYGTGGILGDVDAIKMALMKMKPAGIVFGTDYPSEIRDPEVTKKFIADIRALPLPPEDIEAMLGGNGRVLIGV